MSAHRTRLLLVSRFAWVVLVMAVVAVSLRPLPPGMDIPGGDKTAHLMSYMVLALTFPWTLTWKRSLVFCGFLMGVGALLEWGQHVMAIGRSGEVADALANAAGACVGCMIRSLRQHGIKD